MKKTTKRMTNRLPALTVLEGECVFYDAAAGVWLARFLVEGLWYLKGIYATEREAIRALAVSR